MTGNEVVQDANTLLANALGLEQGDTPFPWQEDVLTRFMQGEIPAALDIPTGLGKTAVMAIWLVARACGADLPRRLVYVVDRRAVVDQATEEALKLRAFVDSEASLGERLGLRYDQSLPISTLRGQYVDNREWLEDPAAPAIVIGTVDMVGSRLLFEGYGVSRKMRPYHAGLLGADALVVLDEAHLVPPFERLLRAIATDPAFRPSSSQQGKPVPQFHLLALSATGRSRAPGVVELTGKDHQHPIVKKRLNAKKLLRIAMLDENTKLQEKLAEEAWSLTEDGKKAVRVIVYSDSRKVAQMARDAVDRRAKRKKSGTPALKMETEIFVGGRRVFEREQTKDRLKKLGFIAGSKVACACPVFLFATSAGEVGVDLDADHMVCDLVAWERMVQRLGRVNRRGDGAATVVVIVEPKPKPDKKEQEALEKRTRNEELDDNERKHVEGYEKKVLAWENRQKPLKIARKSEDGTLDVSPAALLDLKTRAMSDASVQKILDDATTPDPLRPALTRPLVDAWAMTSLERHTGRPEIEPWLRGWIKDDPPQTRVVWRKYLPVRLGGLAPRDEEVEAFFEAAPPHMSEILETEMSEVENWIIKRANCIRKLLQEQGEVTNGSRLREDDVVAFALDPDGGLRRRFMLKELESPDDKEKLRRLLSGATLVVDARLGGLKDGLLDPEEDGLPRTADDDKDWLGEGAIGFRIRSVDASMALSKDRRWRERLRFASEVSDDGDTIRWLVVEKWRTDAATEEDRSVANPQLLDEHESCTEDCARRLAKALGFNQLYEDLLALAASLHDEGKRAPRWQRSFNAPADGIYAKTAGPINYRLLDGYRHELGSLLRVEKDERILKLSDDDRDLVLHLIVAHHGFARPVIGTASCEDMPPSVLQEKASEIALRFARLQARWGPWGLAWWESLLRAADQQASRANASSAISDGDA